MTFGGTGGRLFERSFGSFENFLGAVPSIEDLRWEVGDVTTELGKQRAREVYDRRVLLDEHEGFFGYREGDAQACHGDSGGPIFRVVDGKRTVFGVTSWGTHRFGAFCDFGGVYAVLSPTVYAFVEKSLAWVDPCDGLPQAGRCEGTVAVRCSTLREGVRRRLATECADLGLVCGAGADGQVNCQ